MKHTILDIYLEVQHAWYTVYQVLTNLKKFSFRLNEGFLHLLIDAFPVTKSNFYSPTNKLIEY